MGDTPSTTVVRACPAGSAAARGGLALMTLLLVAAGCAATKPMIVTRQHPYDPAEYASYLARGKAMLTGQAVAKTSLGHQVIGAEDSVYLFPATPYADEWWERSLIEGYYLPYPDPRSLAFLHSTQTDEVGNFQFGPLAAGEYYVVCAMNVGEAPPGTNPQWELYSTVPRGDVVNVGKRIRLAATDTVHVVLEPISHSRVLVDPAPSDSK
jgi:hypothetical protein